MLMSSTFANGPDTDPVFMAYGPGAKLLDVHARPPLGPCVPTVHMMGYWYDKTKFGPLIYLSHSLTVAPSLPQDHTSPPTPRAFELACPRQETVRAAPLPPCALLTRQGPRLAHTSRLLAGGYTWLCSSWTLSLT